MRCSFSSAQVLGVIYVKNISRDSPLNCKLIPSFSVSSFLFFFSLAF